MQMQQENIAEQQATLSRVQQLEMAEKELELTRIAMFEKEEEHRRQIEEQKK